MCHFFFGFPFFYGWFGWIWMIVGFIIIMVLISVIFLRKNYIGYITHTHDHIEGHNNENEEFIKILKRMYVKGEISEEEYEKRKRNLEK